MIVRLGVARRDFREAVERRRNAKSCRRSFEWENFFANGPKAFSGGSVVRMYGFHGFLWIPGASISGESKESKKRNPSRPAPGAESRVPRVEIPFHCCLKLNCRPTTN